jgi:hypothetical protein
MSTETKLQYIEYVRNQLKTIDKTDAVASYDTGFGLDIVDTHLGDEVHCMDVRCHSILKIRPPNIQGNEWYTAWKHAKRMVRTFCKQL